MSEPTKHFEFTFEDESASGKLTFDYSVEDDELLRFGQEQGEIFVLANRSGCLALAKIFLKLALGGYQPGYHVHLGEDFSASGLSLGLIADHEESEQGAG